MPDYPGFWNRTAGLAFTDRVNACVRRKSAGKSTAALSMSAFRRPLASCALFLVILQIGLLVAAPVSACCAEQKAAAPPSCCKLQSHSSNPCPMHSRPAPRSDECRMTCAHRDPGPLLLGVLATLTPPPALSIPLVSQPVRVTLVQFVRSQTSTPDSPPPEARAS
jgi:hypothetical protein